MPITINGSGTVTGISAGGLPDGVITTDDIAAGAVTQAKRSEGLTLGTAQTATGVAVDFTGIPSWVKRITVMFNGVSTSGTSITQIQVGSGTLNTSGYASGYGLINGGTGQNGSTTGFAIGSIAAADNINGAFVLCLVNANTWVINGTYHYTSSVGAVGMVGGRSPSLSGTLDRLRITTVNGTDTFDAGSINILYE